MTPAVAQEKVTVFAAASLKNALDAVNDEWKRRPARSDRLLCRKLGARQADRGRRAGRMFISADLDWMEYVAEKNLIKEDTRANLLGNRIVLVAAKQDAKPVEIKHGFDLKGCSATGGSPWAT